MRYIIFFLLFMILFSCNKKTIIDSIPARDVIHVSFNNMEEQQDSILDLIEEINLIPLDLDSTFLLYGMPQMRITNENIYFFDNKRDVLYGFASSGEYLFQIDKKGNGPEEYINLSNFTLTKSSEIIIYDVPKTTMHIYDKDGNYIEKKKIDCPLDNIAYLNDSLFVAYTRLFSLFSNDKEGIKFINKHGSVTNRFLNLPDWIQKSSLVLATGSNFSYSDYNPRLILSWGYNVYSFTPDTIICKYQIDFRGHNIPESFLVNMGSKKDENYGEVMHSIIENGWVSSLDFYQESSNYSYFQFLKEGYIYYTFFNKNERTAFTTSFNSLPTEWRVVLKPFLCSYHDTFYSLVSISQMEIMLSLSEIKDIRLTKLINQYINYNKNSINVLEAEDQVLISFKMKSPFQNSI